MKAIIITQPGGPENLKLVDMPTPVPGPHELLVEIVATAVNRADLLQCAGHYPPPPGASEVPGLEMAGYVVDKGILVKDWKIGDAVCGLLAGGGYATHCVIHEKVALPIPAGMEVQDAAALPEVFMTAFQTLHWLGQLDYGERVLIHAGASGVGTAAIQLAQLKSAEIMVTASAHKHPLCRELGADFCIDYREDDFAAAVEDYTQGKGVDVILDFVGAPYFTANVNSLAPDGRLIMIGFLGGAQVREPVHLSPILFKRLRIQGTTLRARDLTYKVRLAQELKAQHWSDFDSGALRPVIDSVFPLSEVGGAHQRMADNLNQGKIILRI